MSSLSKNTFDIKFEDILEQVSKYIEDEEQINVIKKAYEFALNKHEGQYSS